MRAIVRRSVIGWMAAAIMVAAIVACEEEPSEPAILQPAGYGVVRGVLRGVERPDEWAARLLGAASDGPTETVAALCDSSGAFELRAPYGSYYLAFGSRYGYSTGGYYSAHGLVAAGGDVLELNVGRERIEVDAALLTVLVRLLPDSSQRDHRLSATLKGTDLAGHAVSRSGGAWCEGDSLVIAVGRMLPGTYTLQVSDGSMEVDLPVEGDPADPGPLVLRADSVATPWYRMPAPTRVSIRVRGSWPDLIAIGASPSLRALRPDSSLLGSMRSSDELILANWWSPDSICFRVDLNHVARWIGGDSFDEARRYALIPGESIELPEIHESGMLVRVDFETPGEYSFFTIHLRSGDGGRSLAEVDTRGNYVALSNLDPGTYRLQVESLNRCEGVTRPEWYEDGTSPENATPIVIAEPGELIHLDWLLNDGGEIHGRIDAPPSVPGWDHDVELLSASDSTQSLCREYGSTGGYEFRFTGLADGPYVLCAPFPSFGRWRNWWYPGTWNRAQAETLWVRDATIVETGPWEGR